MGPDAKRRELLTEAVAAGDFAVPVGGLWAAFSNPAPALWLGVLSAVLVRIEFQFEPVLERNSDQRVVERDDPPDTALTPVFRTNSLI
jgi:hypothetical protein